MATVQQLWDQYDLALETCLEQGVSRPTSIRTLARAAALLIVNGQLADTQAVYEAAEAGFSPNELDELRSQIDLTLETLGWTG